MAHPVQQLQQDLARAHLATAAAAYAFGAPLAALETDGSGGGRKATTVRQIAMYLAHVSFGMNLTRVALAFSRDRSTASHACHKIEDARDDTALDRRLEALEECLRAAPLPEPGRP